MQVDIFNTNNKYNIIYADPAWSFKTYSDKGKDRSPDNHYNVMSLADLKNLPVGKLAAKNCILFMWVIDTMIPEALEVIKAWGFKYKTVGFTWTKVNKSAKLDKLNVEKDFFTGMGYYTRANDERCFIAFNHDVEEDENQVCLLATTKDGSPKRQSASVRRAVLDYRREHSRKPDQIYTRIEQLVGELPRIELFGRTERPGWDVWGNEVGKFEIESK